MSNPVELLRAVPFFGRLSDQDYQAIAKLLVQKSFLKDTDIVTQGDIGTEFFILVKGTAVVLKNIDLNKEKQVKVADLNRGDYFGEAALLNKQRRGATVRAVTDCECYSLDANSFMNAAVQDVNVAKRRAVLSELHHPPIEKAAELLEKSNELKDLLKASITKMTKIFKELDEEQLESVVAGMWRVDVKKGESIIRQGDPGDNFYVVEKGEFDIWKNGEKVNYASSGICFGELALMYNAPRAATVTALCDSVVWCVDRFSFRTILRDKSKQKLEEYDQLLKNVPILQSLLPFERIKVAEALDEISFPDKAVIVKQGDPGDAFYIIKKGTVICTKRDNSTGIEKEVAIVRTGEFFGEIALLKSVPRAATVTAVGHVDLLKLNQIEFDLLMGPLKEILGRVDWDSKEHEVKRVRSTSPEFQEESKQEQTIKFEDLEILGVLGRGSFGIVQFVRHKKTRQHFALKKISKAEITHLNQQDHILNEKHVMSLLNHPFIVKLYATFKDKDYLYFLLEVCLGGELFTILRARRRFNEETAKFYAACVILAFESMHQHDIVYRDLKPENLLLDSKGYIKIADFGFAKVCKDRTYTLCGTPDYLAPEVIFGQGHGKGVDWWTLGVLLFEMVASYPPFFDEDPMKTYGKIMHGIYEFPRFFSPELVDLIQKLLHPKATKRLGIINGGASLLKSHPWFSGFDWAKLYKRELQAPHIPPIAHGEDLRNFTEVSSSEQEFASFPSVLDTSWSDEF
jgi:cGMP-dependent protein kinase